MSSTDDSGTDPSWTAATRAAPQGPFGPGMTRSSSSSPAAASVRAAYQSDMTSPSKPHSPLSTSRCSGDSVIVVPLTWLYADMTAHTPSATIVSNGAR